MKVLKSLNFDQSGRVSVTYKGKINMIEINTILYCRAQGNYTEIHLTNGTSVIDSYCLKYMRLQLEEYGFFSIDKSHIINLLFIRSITQKRCAMVTLNNCTELKVSRDRKSQLLKILF